MPDTINLANAALLQRSRSLSTAEIQQGRAAIAHPAQSSTEPQSFDCGDVLGIDGDNLQHLGLQRSRSLSTAEMYLELTGTISSTLVFNGAAVFRLRRYEVGFAHLAALQSSTEPQSFDCGDLLQHFG